MTESIKKIYNCETGEEIEREMTADEVEQKSKDEAEYQAFLQAKAEAKAKRESAIAKLADLGLDMDDLKALGL